LERESNSGVVVVESLNRIESNRIETSGVRQADLVRGIMLRAQPDPRFFHGPHVELQGRQLPSVGTHEELHGLTQTQKLLKYDVIRRKTWFAMFRKCLLCADETQNSLIYASVDGYGAIKPPAKLIPFEQVLFASKETPEGRQFELRVKLYFFDQEKASKKPKWKTVRFMASSRVQADEWVGVINRIVKFDGSSRRKASVESIQEEEIFRLLVDSDKPPPKPPKPAYFRPDNNVHKFCIEEGKPDPPPRRFELDLVERKPEISSFDVRKGSDLKSLPLPASSAKERASHTPKSSSRPRNRQFPTDGIPLHLEEPTIENPFKHGNASAKSEHPPVLPPRPCSTAIWMSAQTSDGMKYYFNSKGEARWDKPL